MKLLERAGAALAGCTVAAAALVGVATPAQAATPSCVGHKYYNAASGGCNGNLTAGSDRMDIQCKWIGAGYYTFYGTWHNRYADWQEFRQCNGGSTISAVWFEHRG